VRSYDINKDGISDLFIGSPERTFELGGEDRDDAGVSELIYGRRDFLPPVIKLYDPPAAVQVYQLAGAHGEDQGVEGGDEFSYRLTGGDVDGDGYVDYIANAMHGDGFNNSVLNGGNVYIFSGKKLSARLGQLVQEPSLPPRLRVVVEGYFFQERPMAEIAAELGVTESRVSQLRAEALELLRDGLNTQLDPELVASRDKVTGCVARRRETYYATVAAQGTLRSRLARTTVMAAPIAA